MPDSRHRWAILGLNGIKFLDPLQLARRRSATLRFVAVRPRSRGHGFEGLADAIWQERTAANFRPTRSAPTPRRSTGSMFATRSRRIRPAKCMAGLPRVTSRSHRERDRFRCDRSRSAPDLQPQHRIRS